MWMRIGAYLLLGGVTAAAVWQQVPETMAHLPPLERVPTRVVPATFARLVGTLAPGRRELRAYTPHIQPSSSPRMLEGTILDPAGHPVAGLSLLPYGKTDRDGEFMIPMMRPYVVARYGDHSLVRIADLDPDRVGRDEGTARLAIGLHNTALTFAVDVPHRTVANAYVVRLRDREVVAEVTGNSPVIRHLAPDRYRVYVLAGSYEAATRVVTIERGVTDLGSIALRACPVVATEVVHTDDWTVPHTLRVSVQIDDDVAVWRQIGQIVGGATMEGVPPGRHTIHVTGWNGSQSIQSIDTSNRPVRIELPTE
ncbi:MAG: hypothetical protein OER88_05075 [Planctomycetota bacterium]|nr:hypothetical protein [Planctomycetota bacterium]